MAEVHIVSMRETNNRVLRRVVELFTLSVSYTYGSIYDFLFHSDYIVFFSQLNSLIIKCRIIYFQKNDLQLYMHLYNDETVNAAIVLF